MCMYSVSGPLTTEGQAAKDSATDLPPPPPNDSAISSYAQDSTARDEKLLVAWSCNFIWRACHGPMCCTPLNGEELCHMALKFLVRC